MNQARQHFRFGLWTLFVFSVGGLCLEALHGFKVPMYLDVGNETRRLMWRLAHAHGTLLGLVHLGYGAMVQSRGIQQLKRHKLTTGCLRAATFMLPGGFVLGGAWIYGSDPGLGAMILSPLGGVLLVVGLLFAALDS